jgi:hypothetical protein
MLRSLAQDLRGGSVYYGRTKRRHLWHKLHLHMVLTSPLAHGSSLMSQMLTHQHGIHLVPSSRPQIGIIKAIANTGSLSWLMASGHASKLWRRAVCHVASRHPAHDCIPNQNWIHGVMILGGHKNKDPIQVCDVQSTTFQRGQTSQNVQHEGFPVGHPTRVLTRRPHI